MPPKRPTPVPAIRRPLSLAEISPAFAVGSPLTDTVAVESKPIPLAGAARVRLRWRSKVAGSLELILCGLDADSDGLPIPYEQNQPTAVAVSANTETLLDIDPYMGEPWGIVKFTPSATDAAGVELADLLQV